VFQLAEVGWSCHHLRYPIRRTAIARENLTERSATESNHKELRLQWLKILSAAYISLATLACSVFSFTRATSRPIGSGEVLVKNLRKRAD
jgi:hypothetical protein